MTRIIPVWLTLLIPLWIAAPSAVGQDAPAILNIRILEGDGAIYAPGSRATRGVTVQVTDETGKPVEGSSVSFTLPENGPGGAFTNGSKTDIATTHVDGRAMVWGMQWNRVAGPFEIRITAVKGPARAGTLCAESLSEAAPSTGSSLRHVSGGSHKWIWIALAVAGAAGGAVAATSLGKSSPSTTASPVAIQIGNPTISLGKP